MTLDPRKMASRQNSAALSMKEFILNEYSASGDDERSIITLEDRFSSASLTPNPEFEHEEEHIQDENIDDKRMYDLPTHISSHYEVVDNHSRTQPPSPASTTFRNSPTHPLRALTGDIVSLGQSNHRILSSSPMNPHGFTFEEANALIIDSDEERSIEEEAHILNQRKHNEWAEKGAAELIKKSEDSDQPDEVIRKSVKDFTFGKTLGVGSYSTVLLATDKNNDRQFAVKVLDKRHIIKEKKVKYVNIEKNTLKRLGRRNGIVHMFFAFQDESSLYFVLDFASHGELLNLIKEHGTLNEEVTRYYGAQILDAIKYMHDNGVVHRDLKPENILLDSNLKIQITDFGTAKLLEKDSNGNYPADTRAKSFVGTAEYVSPELLNEKAIGKGCDIWAFGCIIYQMIAGKPPFKATNEYLTFQKIVKLQYAFTAGFPMIIRDLVKRILKLNPKDRLTIKEIQNHYFFQGIDFMNSENSVWSVDPPEIGPYKITAKSMLPVPELSNQKTRITIPRRVISQPSTPKSDINSTDDEELIESPAASAEPTPSQKVLMKAKAAVAARKQHQLSKQAEITKRAVSTGNAANAASIALSRQPNDIIKQQEAQNQESIAPATFSRELRSPLMPSSSTFNEHNISTASEQARPIRKPPVNSPTTRVSSATVPPMSKLDLEFIDFLRNNEERILKRDVLNVNLTTVDSIEKKFKGRLVDSPLGSNNKSSTSLLSQVAKGSYKSLRNMDQYGVESERSIITNHSASEDDSSTIANNAKSRFKKLFNHGSNDDGIANKKNRTIIITNQGRFLIFEIDKETSNLKLRTEINVAHPVIRVKELIQISTSTNAEGLFVIESYNTAFTFEGPQVRISSWAQVIHKARMLVSEADAQRRLEKDPSGQAGTILGSDAAKSAANIASVHSPPLSPTALAKDKSSFITTSLEEEEQKASTTSHSSSKSAGMFKDLVRQKDATRSSSSRIKELPGNGQLYHGLPASLLHAKSSNSVIAAASAAALSSQQNTSTTNSTVSSSSNGTSSFSEHTHRSVLGSGNSSSQTSGHKVITGMNSRMLLRSHDRRKKK